MKLAKSIGMNVANIELRALDGLPAEDSLALVDWQIFNFLAGNSDGHAKNLSILYSKDNPLRRVEQFIRGQCRSTSQTLK